MNEGNLSIEATGIRFLKGNHSMLQLINACVRALAYEQRWQRYGKKESRSSESKEEKKIRIT